MVGCGNGKVEQRCRRKMNEETVGVAMSMWRNVEQRVFMIIEACGRGMW